MKKRPPETLSKQSVGLHSVTVNAAPDGCQHHAGCLQRGNSVDAHVPTVCCTEGHICIR